MQMTEQCQYCWKKFKSVQLLSNHHQTAKNCKKYQYIGFTCYKCGYKTKGIQNINLHITKCNEEESVYGNVSEKDLTVSYDKLKQMVLLERYKNKIYRQIIEKNTNIKLDDVIYENPNEIHLTNTYQLDLSFIVHDPENHIKLEKPVKPPEPDKEADKKKIYRPIKHIPIQPEVPQTITQERVDNVKTMIENQRNSFGNLSETLEKIQECLTTLKTSRMYTKILNELQKYRWSLLGRLSISEYIKLIEENVNDISHILDDKKYNTKKCKEIISKSLSGMDSRLIRYGNYYSSMVEVDEIDHFRTALDLHVNSVENYVPFNISQLSNNFYNYGVALFSLNSLCRLFLINKYQFHNIIYVALPKNTPDDPFSYYTLDKVQKDKRYWQMDCRMENTSLSLISMIQEYQIDLFRKIYNDVFGDNIFRSDYYMKFPITEYDCEQLLQNILLLGQPKKFCNLLRDIVKELCTYTPTSNDKFNLYGDDALQRKRFHDKEDVELVDVIKQLFDDISTEESVDFYRGKF